MTDTLLDTITLLKVSDLRVEFAGRRPKRSAPSTA